ncbi:Adenylate kinase [Candidatus Burarchaeum australiense]|nr:Adenylate kinase [Candidatus Burarchaeum australiense]
MIIVMGTPGAGKSTVLGEASKDRKEWTVVNYGDLMVDIAKEKKLVSSRDELRKLSVANQRTIQAAVGDKLSKMGGKVILDTHCSINTPQGYYPGLPNSLLAKLRVDALVLVNAPLEDILGRRKSDTARVRDAQVREELAEHIRINEAMLAAYSVLSGAPVLIIDNANGKLDVAVERLEALLGSFKA